MHPPCCPECCVQKTIAMSYLLRAPCACGVQVKEVAARWEERCNELQSRYARVDLREHEMVVEELKNAKQIIETKKKEALALDEAAKKAKTQVCGSLITLHLVCCEDYHLFFSKCLGRQGWFAPKALRAHQVNAVRVSKRLIRLS